MTTIKLLTFNAWGLRLISKFRNERLKALGDILADPISDDEDYDIVALQEVWTEEDWAYIDNMCKQRYPYRRHFKLGIIAGPGLALLSKIPIEETFLYRFPINGRPLAVFRGDWYVGKSIAVTLLKPVTPNSTPIALLNSHMHAPYSLEGDALYSCHRACQAWDFAKYVRMLRKAGYAVIQVGDLNSQPGTLPHRLFTVEGGLDDLWELCHPEKYSRSDIATMTPIDQIRKAGITCDSVLNTWRINRPIEDACRLDYAFVDSSYITPIRAEVRFIDPIPELNCSLSDHFAYFVELDIADYDANVVRRVRSDSYGAARAIRARKGSSASNTFPSTSTTKDDEFRDLKARVLVYRDLLTEISKYRRYTIPYQLLWRKHHFFSLIAIVVGLHFVVTLSAVRSDPIAAGFTMLVSLLVGVLGIINGLIWGLGIRAELRALQEVQQQVKDKVNAIKDEVNEFLDWPTGEIDD